MLATIRDDIRNVLNMLHITPNSKKMGLFSHERASGSIIKSIRIRKKYCISIEIRLNPEFISGARGSGVSLRVLNIPKLKVLTQ